MTAVRRGAPPASEAAGIRRSFLTADDATLRVLDLAARAASSASTVLLLGEPGTGKSLLARAMHRAGARSSRPFVEIPCANLPADLVESELFGHERGAFTGAVERRIGRFEAADGGTVLLDGIAELPPALQSKLLRVLQERSFERLGGSRTVRVNVRVMASAPPGIERMASRGEFREDLLYRLHVVTLRLPALRERPADIPLLAGRFLAEAARRAGSPVRRFAAEASDLLERYGWPGNVRELMNVCEFAALRGAGEEATLADLPLESMDTAGALVAHSARRGLTLSELEAAYIREILWRMRGNRSAAARMLGISRKTLLEKRRRYGLD